MTIPFPQPNPGVSVHGLWIEPVDGGLVRVSVRAPIELSADDVIAVADALFAARNGTVWHPGHRLPWSPQIARSIIEKAARAFGVEPHTLADPFSWNERDVARARDVAAFLCRELTDGSSPQIAAVFRRNHSTILSAIAKVQVRERMDEGTRNLLAALRREITP